MGAFFDRLNFLTCLTTTLVAATLAVAETKSEKHAKELLSVPMSGVDARQWHILSNLQVNKDPARRYVIPNVCENEGKAMLRTLALTADVEESYVFIPLHCLWIEVGYNETTTQVRLDHKFIDRLLTREPVISMYHIHIGTPENVQNYFPAYSDLISLVLVNASFINRQDKSIKHHATTPLGTISYELVQNKKMKHLVDKMRRSGLTSYVAQNLAYEYAHGSYRKDYYRAVEKCARLVKNDPNNIDQCFPIKLKDFILTFERGAPLAISAVDE